jgi:hypothetical protein
MKHIRLLLALTVLIFAAQACSLQFNPPPIQPGGTGEATSTPILIPPTLTSTAEPIPATETAVPTETPTQLPSPTPLAYDQSAGAFRIKFDIYGTWAEVSDQIPPQTEKRYVVTAMQGQVMSVSVLADEGYNWGFSVDVRGADGKALSSADVQRMAWRGKLPSTQDYLIIIKSYSDISNMTLRVAINPPGEARQFFKYVNRDRLVAIRYSDEFAPANPPPGIEHKGSTEITLTFIDESFYAPITNLGEAFFVLDAADDPQVVATCTQPAAPNESIDGERMFGGLPFTRSLVADAAAGNIYEQIIYRTVWENTCYEIVFFMHSGNIGNYTPGAVIEFDRTALIAKFEEILATISIK